MKRAALAVILPLLAAPRLALAADPDQTNDLMFGLMGAYVPHQNNLPADVAAVGQYVAYAHNLDVFYLGFRLALLYGWLPSGAAGQQYIIEPDVLVGVHGKIKPITLRAELGTGPFVNGGEGFATTIVNHTYLRGIAQWTIVKTFTVEAFVGPSLVIGPYVAGFFPEFGLGCGWNF